MKNVSPAQFCEELYRFLESDRRTLDLSLSACDMLDLRRDLHPVNQATRIAIESGCVVTHSEDLWHRRMNVMISKGDLFDEISRREAWRHNVDLILFS